MIKVEQVSKSFHGVRALDGFSLNVRRGELVGLVGPNGAGKTTLINILSTLLLPDGGIVQIDGKSVSGDPYPIRRVVGYLADQSGLYQEMRVREFLEFFADAFHMKGLAREHAIASALAHSELQARSSDLVEDLSFGMRQRLMLTKTLIHSPALLLLDEPANGLDPIARIQLRQFLKDLHARGLTILISSHILADLEDICTQVVLISEGKNVADDEGNTVLQIRHNGQPGTQVCEIELSGDAPEAVDIVAALGNVQVLQVEPRRLLLAVRGADEQVVNVLRTLVAEGVAVIGFNRRTAGLEERYRSAFGGNQ